MIENIFLDMDGVLCQFHEAALKLHRRNSLSLLRDWPKGEYDICKVTGINGIEFWGKIAQYSPNFWRQLLPCLWARELYDTCRKVAAVTISTRPTLDVHSVLGKLQWIELFFGPDFRDYMIGPAKDLLARRGALLIDDSEANCQAFEKAGGRALLFPRPWNKCHAMDVDRWLHALPNMLNMLKEVVHFTAVKSR